MIELVDYGFRPAARNRWTEVKTPGADDGLVQLNNPIDTIDHADALAAYQEAVRG
jgi:hypothetical protein